MSAEGQLHWPTPSRFAKLLESQGDRPGSSWGPNQIAFLLANFAICLAELTSPTVSNWAFMPWVMSALAISGVRAGLYYAITRQGAPARAKNAPYPGLIAGVSALSAIHWIGTVWLFVGQELTTTTGVLSLGFVMLTLAATRVWSRTPIAAASYVATLWGALSMRSFQVDLMPVEVLIAVDGIAVVITWLGVLAATQMKPLLARSREADRVMAEMKEANETLGRLMDDTASTLEKRSNFFAGASHDFKQRLHAMKLMAFSTIAEVPQDQRAHAALTRMSAEMQELEQYFNEVLDFARIEAIDPAPQKQAVPLQRVMQKVDLHFENVAMARNVRLTFRPTELVVETDPAMLQRILENLVSNALKFTRKGVLVAARKRGADVLLEVWDQGPGVSAELRSRIFDAFHQDASAAIDGQRGVGLGLAVVKRFADRLRCTVSIASRAGRGSVFRVRIPSAYDHRDRDSI